MSDEGTDGPSHSFFEEIMALRRELASADAELASREITGTSGGGAVAIAFSTASGPRTVTIDPQIVEQGDVALLEDLVLAALRDADQKLNAARASVLSEAVSTKILGAKGIAETLSSLLGDDDPQS